MGAVLMAPTNPASADEGLSVAQARIASSLPDLRKGETRKLSRKQIAAKNRRIAARNKRILLSEAKAFAFDNYAYILGLIRQRSSAGERGLSYRTNCYGSTPRGASCWWTAQIDRYYTDTYSPYWARYLFGGTAHTIRVGNRIRYSHDSRPLLGGVCGSEYAC
jgi:hypothetical protein